MPECRWTDCGGSCNGDENEMTWQWGGCRKGKRRNFCCAKEQKWKNCGWKGKPGNCDDNHCDVGWQVALTTSYEGEDKDCGFWHQERERSFCCDPPDDKSPFMPVPLDFLFEDPPDQNTADTDFTLKVDPTFGGSNNVPFNEDPANAPFGFVVLTSPEELQVSLDRRDGSHWDVFDCFDAVTEGEHTVRMVCTDESDASNCYKIHLGHGAPGTIVQMPEGCGPGKYAVVKSLEASKNQSLPHHVTRRSGVSNGKVYDLNFDYDFRRVPRDLGKTQMRIDFSNEREYWDLIVNKAADHKKPKKRSLDDFGGNHRRWLEEEWRDDAHFGGLSTEELHKRWFGSDIIDWLRTIVNGVKGGLDISHSYNEDFILKIVDERLTCPGFEAQLDVHAETNVDIDVNYGFTLIATLGSPIDLSNSYLYFRTKGGVTAKFVMNAAVTARFDTGDITLFSADKFGAAFSVPGIVVIGPNFKLLGRLEGEATLGVNFESQVKLAQWDIRQTYPATNGDWDPEATGDPNKSGTQNLLEPQFQAGVRLDGHITAHVKPTISFGINFNQDFIPIEPCAVNLIADGHVTFHASLQGGTSGTSFCYGIDAGADLYATIDAPEAFKWALPVSPFPIWPFDTVRIWPRGSQPSCRAAGSPERRALEISVPTNTTQKLINRLGKRAQVYGPLVPRLVGLSCPGSTDLSDIPECPLCGSDSEESSSKLKRGDDGPVCHLDPYATGERCPELNLKRRALDTFDYVNETLEWEDEDSLEHLSKRSTQEKTVKWSYNGETRDLPCGRYETCGSAANQGSVNKWFGFSDLKSPSKTSCKTEVIKQRKDQVPTKEFVSKSS